MWTDSTVLIFNDFETRIIVLIFVLDNKHFSLPIFE